MNKLATAALALALAAGAAGEAAAATHMCTSRIAEVGVDGGGSLTMRFADYGDHFYLCGTATATSGIATDTCKVWLSELLATWSMGRPVSLWFDTANAANAGMTGCTAANFSWNSRPPFFVLMHSS